MRKPILRHRALMVAFALALLGGAGCNDTDERPATWSYISATIIQPNCGTSRCHAVGSEVKGWKFDEQNAYDTLLASCIIVPEGNPRPCPNAAGQPGEPANQELYLAITGNSLERMPPDEPLPQADIDLIEKWIAAGAKRD
jgi:hypothetical protein